MSFIAKLTWTIVCARCGKEDVVEYAHQIIDCMHVVVPLPMVPLGWSTGPNMEVYCEKHEIEVIIKDREPTDASQMMGITMGS